MSNANSTANKIKARLAFHKVSDSDAQVQFQAALKFAERRERSPQAESQVERLLHDGTALREALDSCQRSGKPLYGLAMGGLCCGLGPGLIGVRHSLVPDLAAHSVV